MALADHMSCRTADLVFILCSLSGKEMNGPKNAMKTQMDYLCPLKTVPPYTVSSATSSTNNRK